MVEGKLRRADEESGNREAVEGGRWCPWRLGDPSALPTETDGGEWCGSATDVHVAWTEVRLIPPLRT